MRGFPIHRHANPGATARMIEEDEFLHRRRIQFAISAEFERHFRESIRLARGIDAEGIGLHFRDAGDGVVDWGDEEGDRREN